MFSFLAFSLSSFTLHFYYTSITISLFLFLLNAEDSFNRLKERRKFKFFIEINSMSSLLYVLWRFVNLRGTSFTEFMLVAVYLLAKLSWILFRDLPMADE